MPTFAASETAPDAGLALTLLVAGTFFMENLDGTVITPALPLIAQSFGVAPVDLSIGVSAYMLTLGVFIPISGWVADRFGARRIFPSAVMLFTVASVLCGLSQNLGMFVAARVLQGIGGAMMVPVGRLVVLRVTPKHRLIHAIAVLTWPALIAPVLGPPLGGWIAEHADWRWIFYLNLPLGIAAFFFALRLVSHGPPDKKPSFDWPGFLLTSSALVCLLWASEIPSHPDANWNHAILAALAGLVLAVACVRHMRRAKNPMIDLSVLRTPTFAVTIFGGSLFRMGVSALPFLLPLLFQLGFDYSAFQSGMMLMAVFAGNLLVKPFTTPILRKFGFRRTLVVNGILNVLCIAACATLSPGLPLAGIYFILFLSGVTRSIQFTALNTLAFADIPDDRMNQANTLFSTAFQLAFGLGIALGAIALRTFELVAPPGDILTPFRGAFLLVAGVSLAGLWDSIHLHPASGHNVAARRRS